MISAFRNIFKIGELRSRILFTLALLIVYRLGTYVPTPGVDARELSDFFRTLTQDTGANLFGLMNMFSGGALSQCTIFALGIMPYISASIILQLLTAVVPTLERLAKEGETGRRKINQYTRYGTVLLCLFQAGMITRFLENPANFQGRVIIPNPGWGTRLLVMITITAGTVFIMWLGEQITENGIGNGISLIITAGIISRLPSAGYEVYERVRMGDMRPYAVAGMAILMALVIAAVVLVTEGQRRIPIQRPKQIRGRKIYSAQSTYIPLRVNQAGVIPIIFASSILLFPATIGGFVQAEWLRALMGMLTPGAALYILLEVILIIFFCYFYTAITFNPIDLAENMKKSGAFVPGIRPGRPTADFFERVMNRITLPGAIFLAAIAVTPSVIASYMNVSYTISQFFGGTGLLIIVGVMLDTMRQVESHLVMRHYEGFMRKGRVRGR
ncbi:MAG: preprotein translocase subunit SecY [bacterium]|nr:preprotein translocase subunit SecY [bacterium]